MFSYFKTHKWMYPFLLNMKEEVHSLSCYCWFSHAQPKESHACDKGNMWTAKPKDKTNQAPWLFHEWPSQQSLKPPNCFSLSLPNKAINRIELACLFIFLLYLTDTHGQDLNRTSESKTKKIDKLNEGVRWFPKQWEESSKTTDSQVLYRN